MADASKITTYHAAQAYDDSLGSRDDSGSLTVDGQKVDWWADSESVWFYEPGHDGEDTIKRFRVFTEFVEVK